MSRQWVYVEPQETRKRKKKKAKTGDLEIIFKINIIISPG